MKENTTERNNKGQFVLLDPRRADETPRQRNTRQKREWNRRNPERVKEINDNYRKRHPDKVKEINKKLIDKRTLPENREAYRKYLRERHLKKKFGLTVEMYNQMFEAQNGKCAICGIPRTELSRNLAIDHSHKTGKVRKLLCIGCNMILGSSKENIETLMKCIKYINYYESR